MQNIPGKLDFFFVEVKGKPVCPVCSEALAVMKKAHSVFLCQSLSAEQAAFTRPRTDRGNITGARFVVSKLIATKLKPYPESL